ncbi:MAG: 50S ribosomal protein L13 [Candidatus Aenigmarchaeota archaeon]|nr:50S ribosomal protein L13 [Candidatus Aenigmarchaeota archaeon]
MADEKKDDLKLKAKPSTKAVKKVKKETVKEVKPSEKKGPVKMESVIDAEDCIAGRIASYTAKRLMKGETISIVNAEKAVVSGNPKATQTFFEEKNKRGDPYHGPFYPRRPEMILRRMIRGMIPRQKAKGRDAFSRLKVFMSVPEEFKGRDFEVIEKTRNRLDHKFTTLGKISKRLGANIE